MANTVTGNPFIIATVTAAEITGLRFDLHKIIWTSSSTVGNSVVVQDTDGTVKWQANAHVVDENISDNFDPPIRFNGLKVPTLSTGTVLMYVNVKR